MKTGKSGFSSKVACAACVCALAFAARGASLLKEGDTILLVGDSITEQAYRFKRDGFYHQLTNAAAATVPQRRLTFIPLGYSGIQMAGWAAMERDSRARARWTNYRDPGWNLQEVFAGKVDVVAIFLGMNDILQPSLRDDERDFAAWQETARTFVRNLRARCRPRLFVFCTITPLTADPDSPKNVVRGKLNARLRALAAEEGGVVADYGAAIEDLIAAGRRVRPDLQMVPDFVHPRGEGHTAMALALARALGEEPMAAFLARRLEGERARLAASVKGPALSHRLRMLRTARPDDDDLVYELRWTWRDDDAPRAVARVPQVSLRLPEGWTAAPGDVCGTEGTFHLRGRPDRVSTAVTLVASCGGRAVEQAVAVPAPWRVSAPFDFPAAWRGQTWLTNAAPPVAFADAGGWRLATATMDYTGYGNPDALDPFQTFFGFRNDSFYAVRWVRSEKARRVKAQFAHRTFSATLGLTLAVNGADVFAGDMNRTGKNALEAEIDLRAGWNELRIRCDHANWQRQFSCSLAPCAGDDLSDLRYGWKPPRR